MRLLSCRVENFGKLHDMQIDFAEGLNLLCRENGWGKSTFAAFLKAMFYGFADTSSRDIAKNERLRYKPWQNGTYGGTVIFCEEDRTYELTRIFGAKEKLDIFELRDAATNLISSDYDESLGEVIFGIDRESFARTLFIGQHDCATAVTDNIHASIGRLSVNTADLNNYDDAMNRLEETARAISPGLKKGSAYRRAYDINVLESELRGEASLAEEYEKCSAYLSAADAEYARLQERSRALAGEREQAAERILLRDRKRQWNRLRDKVSQLETTAGEYRAILPEKLPEPEQVEQGFALLERATLALERARLSALTPEERSILSELSDTAADTEDEATAGQTTAPEVEAEEMIGLWNNRLIKAAALTPLELLAEEKQAEYEKTLETAKMPTAVEIIGGILFAAGILAMMFTRRIAASVPALLGSLLILVSLVRKAGRKAPELPGMLQQTLEKIVEDKLFLQSADEKIGGYLQRHGFEFDEELNLTRLQAIAGKYRAQISRLAELRRKAELADETERQYQGCKKELLDCIRACGISGDSPIGPQLIKLRAALDDYLDESRAAAEARRELETFESEVDTGRLCELDEQAEAPSPEALQEEYTRLEDELEECRKDRSTYRDSLNVLQERRDALEDARERLQILREEQEKELRTYELANRARGFLQQAKENMTARYADPVMTGFCRYYEMLAGQQADSYRMDANLQLTYREQGLQRDTGTLSAGLRDLVGIALRVSLADAVCGGRSSLLILDDPFTDLDDEKTAAALGFLEELAGTHQILYFTCSDSRCGG